MPRQRRASLPEKPDGAPESGPEGKAGFGGSGQVPQGTSDITLADGTLLR